MSVVYEPKIGKSLNLAYYYAIDGHAYGPYYLDDLRDLVSAGNLSGDVLVAASGDEYWRPLSQLLHISRGQSRRRIKTHAQSYPEKGLFSFLDRISGLPPAKSFPWKEIFRKSLALNSEADAEAVFLARESIHTVPWVFSRILIGGLISILCLLWTLETYGNTKIVPGLFFIGCVTVPVATLVLLMELCNVSNLNGYRVVKAIGLGGVISIIFTLFLNDLPLVSNIAVSPMFAGPIEESAKLAAVVFVARNWKRAQHVQDGIVIGAAVGAGFAMIETAGYIYESFLIPHESGVMLNWFGALATLSVRAIMSPFAHVLWTAVVAGALWYGSRGSVFKLKGIFSHVFLRIFLFIVGLHAIWNSPLMLPYADGVSAFAGKYVLIGLFGWYVLLQLYNVDTLTAEE